MRGREVMAGERGEALEVGREDRDEGREPREDGREDGREKLL